MTDLTPQALVPVYAIPGSGVFVTLDRHATPPVLLVGGYDDPEHADDYEWELGRVLKRHGLTRADLGEMIDLRDGVRAPHREAVMRILDLRDAPEQGR